VREVGQRVHPEPEGGFGGGGGGPGPEVALEHEVEVVEPGREAALEFLQNGFEREEKERRRKKEEEEKVEFFSPAVRRRRLSIECLFSLSLSRSLLSFSHLLILVHLVVGRRPELERRARVGLCVE